MENTGTWCSRDGCGRALHYGERVIAVFDTEMGGPITRMGEQRPVITSDPEIFGSWRCFCEHFAEECALVGHRFPPRIP